jgi:hypothetical protein
MAPAKPAPLSLESVPALQATTVTPRTVQPVGAVTQPSPAVVLPLESDGFDDDRDGDGDEEASDEALAEHGPPGAALEHHRAWLQPEPRCPRRRGGGRVCWSVAAWPRPRWPQC